MTGEQPNRGKRRALGESAAGSHPRGAVAAVVAAAGFSRRMGSFKPLLPWGGGTVIESVVELLTEGGAAPVLVVTGHRGDRISDQLAGGPATTVFNPDYVRHEMARSFQVGLEALGQWSLRPLGSLLALGDQPHISPAAVGRIIERVLAAPEAVVIPSHGRRRGHPVYLPRRLFGELLALDEGESLRDLLLRHDEEIVYAPLDSDGVRRDMDYPADYRALRARYGERGAKAGSAGAGAEDTLPGDELPSS